MRRTLTILAAVVATVLVVAGVAMAQEEAETTSTEHAQRPGPSLTASGDGTAVLDVDRGGVRLYVVGDVSIEGPADLDVVIESWENGAQPLTEGGTSIELSGFSGSVFIRGFDYTVEVNGHVTLHGHGQGTASLEGEGLWKTRTDKGVWPAALGFDA